MTEADLQRAIRREIERRGGKCIKIHGSRYMLAGTPDLLGTLDGRPFAVEVKLPGQRPTEKQKHELQAWAEQGWSAGVACSIDEALAIVERNQSRL